MLRSMNSLAGYAILATDGEIGKVDDFFFDDQTWGVAYLVVKLGGLLTGRQVLLPPTALGQPDWEKKQFPVAYTMKQVEESPDVDLDKPISRQHEEELFRYFGWTPYWLPAGSALGVLPLTYPVNPPVMASGDAPPHAEGDPHLQSVKDVTGYGIQATDGKIGHVEDFVVEDANWSIRYMVVDTANWLPGRKVLVALSWIDDINWTEELVRIAFTMQMVKESPEYDPSKPINQGYEIKLYDYYGRPIPKESPPRQRDGGQARREGAE
jgi:hypothetical protein